LRETLTGVDVAGRRLGSALTTATPAVLEQAEVLSKVRAGGGAMLDGGVLASTVAFEDVGDALGADLRRALETALGSGAIHPAGHEPLTVFRAGLAYSIGKIARHSRADLLVRFLRDGPYDRPGRFLRKFAGNCLHDDDTARVLRFVCGHIVSSFQGFLAEVLAAGALARWLEENRRTGRIPDKARLHLGVFVMRRQRIT
jgi:hypothetical protein